MLTTTLVRNQRYPNLGDVTITFDDNTRITKTITTLGETDFESGAREPIAIEGLGQSWQVSQLPAPINYPDSSTGTQTIASTNLIEPKKKIFYWNGA
jgi:hypothetical protein